MSSSNNSSSQTERIDLNSVGRTDIVTSAAGAAAGVITKKRNRSSMIMDDDDGGLDFDAGLLGSGCVKLAYKTQENELLDEEEKKKVTEILAAQDKDKPTSYWVSKLEKESATNWDRFYCRNTTNFYKDRHYIFKEFFEIQPPPSSASGPTTTGDMKGENKGTTVSDAERKVLVEIGCGVGNALLPLVDLCPHLDFYGFDCSKKALELLALQPTFRAERIQLEVHDLSPPVPKGPTIFDKFNKEDAPVTSPVPAGATVTASAAESEAKEPSLSSRVSSTGSVLQAKENALDRPLPVFITRKPADFGTMIFVLSAFSPSQMPYVLRKARECLKLGGKLFMRDYAENDLAMLRFKKGSKLGDKFYMRTDSTRSYFFSFEELDNLLTNAGFEVYDWAYLKRTVENRKEESQMKRTWIQVKAEAV